MDLVEDKVAAVYRDVFLAPKRLRRLREVLQYEATKHDEDREQVIAAQEARLTRLLHEEQKNTIAYQADALSLEVLKLEKDRISKERADARKVIDRASARYDDITATIEQVIDLAANWTTTYRTAPHPIESADS